MSTKRIDADSLAVERANVEIQAVRVGGKAMTIALYEQLPHVDMDPVELSGLEISGYARVLGRVSRSRKACGGAYPCDSLHLIGAVTSGVCIFHLTHEDHNGYTVRVGAGHSIALGYQRVYIAA